MQATNGSKQTGGDAPASSGESPFVTFHDFRPLPFLRNPHVQTLLGTWLNRSTFSHPSRERIVVLDDGDKLVLHDSRPRGWHPGQPIALLVHGLTGSHRSGYIRRLASRLLVGGLRVVRLDLRGAGKGQTLARKSYHAGCSPDVRMAAAEVARWSPSSPLILVGFSLGANVVLRVAGEVGEHPVPNLARVAAVSAPIDLARCSALLSLPQNRFYELHFLRELVAMARRKQRLFPDLPMVRFPPELTVRIFDDLYTARFNGFADADDYYHRASSLPILPTISVPTLLLTSRDDPFIAVEPFETLKTPSHIQVRILDHGGHLGFLGWDGQGGIRWAEKRLAEWILHSVKAF